MSRPTAERLEQLRDLAVERGGLRLDRAVELFVEIAALQADLAALRAVAEAARDFHTLVMQPGGSYEALSVVEERRCDDLDAALYGARDMLATPAVARALDETDKKGGSHV